jgi:hypothetical protein
VAVTGLVVYWRASLPWMVLTAALGATAFMRLTGKSEFLYWQF